MQSIVRTLFYVSNIYKGVTSVTEWPFGHLWRLFLAYLRQRGRRWKCRIGKCGTKCQDGKIQDRNLEDQMKGLENAGPENEGPAFSGSDTWSFIFQSRVFRSCIFQRGHLVLIFLRCICRSLIILGPPSSGLAFSLTLFDNILAIVLCSVVLVVSYDTIRDTILTCARKLT